MAECRVLRAMSTPLLGQFDPDFTTLMQEVIALSRSSSRRRIPSRPGVRDRPGGVEAAIASFTEPAMASSSPSAAASSVR